MKNQHQELSSGNQTWKRSISLNRGYLEVTAVKISVAKLNTIPKYFRFSVADRYMRILVQLHKTFLKSHVKHLFLFSISECRGGSVL